MYGEALQDASSRGVWGNAGIHNGTTGDVTPGFNLNGAIVGITSGLQLQNGQWVPAPVTAATVQRLEEIILTRARDLRRAAIAG